MDLSQHKEKESAPVGTMVDCPECGGRGDLNDAWLLPHTKCKGCAGEKKVVDPYFVEHKTSDLEDLASIASFHTGRELNSDLESDFGSVISYEEQKALDSASKNIKLEVVSEVEDECQSTACSGSAMSSRQVSFNDDNGGSDDDIEPKASVPAKVIEPEEPVPAEVIEPKPPVPAEGIEPKAPVPAEVIEPKAPVPAEVTEPEASVPAEVTEPKAPVPAEVIEPEVPAEVRTKDPAPAMIETEVPAEVLVQAEVRTKDPSPAVIEKEAPVSAEVIGTEAQAEVIEPEDLVPAEDRTEEPAPVVIDAEATVSAEAMTEDPAPAEVIPPPCNSETSTSASSKKGSTPGFCRVVRHKHTTPTASSSKPTSTARTTTANAEKDTRAPKSSTLTWKIVGWVLGGIVGLALIATLTYFLYSMGTAAAAAPVVGPSVV